MTHRRWSHRCEHSRPAAVTEHHSSALLASTASRMRHGSAVLATHTAVLKPVLQPLSQLPHCGGRGRLSGHRRQAESRPRAAVSRCMPPSRTVRIAAVLPSSACCRWPAQSEEMRFYCAPRPAMHNNRPSAALRRAAAPVDWQPALVPLPRHSAQHALACHWAAALRPGVAVDGPSPCHTHQPGCLSWR